MEKCSTVYVGHFATTTTDISDGADLVHLACIVSFNFNSHIRSLSLSALVYNKWLCLDV